MKRPPQSRCLRSLRPQVEEEEPDDPFSSKKKTLAAGGFVPLELLQEFPTEAPLSPARVGKLADYGGLGQASPRAAGRLRVHHGEQCNCKLSFYSSIALFTHFYSRL